MTALYTTARRPPLFSAAGAVPVGIRSLQGLLLRIVLSTGLFALALWLAAEKVDWRQVSEIGAGTVALCLMLSAATILLLAWRWRIVASQLAANQEGVPGLASFARLIWIGLAVNQVLPTVVGGDTLRIALLTRQGMSAARSTVSVIADRLYGLLGLAVLCLLGIPLLDAGLTTPSLLTAVLAGAAVLSIALLAVLVGRHWASARSLASSARSLLTWRTGMVLIAAALAGHVANISVFLVIAHALDIDLPVFAAVAVMALVLLATALPLSIAGWGLRELTLLQAFSHMGAGTDKIILASVIYGVFLLFTQALGFLLLVGRNRP